MKHAHGQPHRAAPTESKKVSFSYGGNVERSSADGDDVKFLYPTKKTIPRMFHVKHSRDRFFCGVKKLHVISVGGRTLHITSVTERNLLRFRRGCPVWLPMGVFHSTKLHVISVCGRILHITSVIERNLLRFRRGGFHIRPQRTPKTSRYLRDCTKSSLNPVQVIISRYLGYSNFLYKEN